MAKKRPAEKYNFATFTFPAELAAQIQEAYKIPRSAVKRLEQAVIGAVKKEVYGGRPNSYVATGEGGAIFDVQGMDMMQLAAIDEAVQQQITLWMTLNSPTDYENATEAEIEAERELFTRLVNPSFTAKVQNLVIKEFPVPAQNTQTRKFLDVELRRAVGKKKDVLITRGSAGVSVMYPRGTFTGDLNSVQKNGKSRSMYEELRNIDKRTKTRVKAEDTKLAQLVMDREARQERKTEEVEQRIYNNSIRQDEAERIRIDENDLIERYLDIPVDEEWTTNERAKRLNEARSVQEMVEDPTFVQGHRIHTLERQALNNSATYSWFTDEDSPGYDTREGRRYRRRLQREEDQENLEGSGPVGRALHRAGMDSETAGKVGGVFGTAGGVIAVIIAIGKMVALVVSTLNKILEKMRELAGASLKDQQNAQMINANTADVRWMTNLERSRPDLAVRSSVQQVANSTASILDNPNVFNAFESAAPVMAEAGYGGIDEYVEATIGADKNPMTAWANMFAATLDMSLGGRSVIGGSGLLPSDAMMANAQEMRSILGDPEILRNWFNELMQSGRSIAEIRRDLREGITSGDALPTLQSLSARWGMSGTTPLPAGQQDAIAQIYRNMQEASSQWNEAMTQIKNDLLLRLAGPLSEVQAQLQSFGLWLARHLGIDTTHADAERDRERLTQYREEVQNLSSNMNAYDFTEQMLIRENNIPTEVMQNINRGRIKLGDELSWSTLRATDAEKARMTQAVNDILILREKQRITQEAIIERSRTIESSATSAVGTIPFHEAVNYQIIDSQVRARSRVILNERAEERGGADSATRHRDRMGRIVTTDAYGNEVVLDQAIDPMTGAGVPRYGERPDVRALQEQAVSAADSGAIRDLQNSRLFEELDRTLGIARRQELVREIMDGTRHLDVVADPQNRELRGVFEFNLRDPETGRALADPVVVTIRAPDTGGASYTVGTDPDMATSRDSRQTGRSTSTRSTRLGGSD